MGAKVTRFRGRAERARQEHLEQREPLLFDVEAVLGTDAARTMRRHFEAQADGLFQVPTKWRFIMLGRNEALQVDAWLHGGGSTQPHLATRLLLHMEATARGDTGEVLLTRGELAERCEALPRHVSTVLSELERGGVLRRVREGRRVRVFLNSRLATGLPEGEREAAQAAERPVGVQLELIEGGASAPAP